MKPILGLKSKFVYNVFLLARGTAFAQCIPVLISPFLTRMFTPAEFGVLALYVSLLSILGVVSTGRYELAIILSKSNNNAIQLLWMSVCITFIFSLVILLFIINFSEQVAQILNAHDLAPLLIFIPISVLMLGATQSILLWFNRQKKYREMALVKVTRASVIGSLQATIGAGRRLDSSLIANWGLISGYIVGQAFGLMSALYSLKKCKIACDLSDRVNLKPNLSQMVKLGYEYRSLPLLNAPSSLLNTVSVQLTPVLLSIFFTSGVIGFFSLSQRILQIPMMLIGGSVGQVYFQEAKEVRDNSGTLRLLTKSINQKLLLIGLFPVSTILMAGDHIFALVFGDAWAVAGSFAQSLAIWIYIVFISSPLSQLMTVLGKQPQLLFFNSILFISRLGWILWAGLIFGNAELVVLGYGVIGSIIWLGFVFYVMHLAGISVSETLKQILPFSIIVLGAAIIGDFI